MTVSAAYVVSPMFATTKVVTFFSSRMTRKARFGNLFRRLVLEGNYLFRVAFFHVGLSRSMTSFATSDLVFPPTYLRQFGM